MHRWLYISTIALVSSIVTAQQISSPDFALRFTGRMLGRGTANLQLDVNKKTFREREKPCHSLWLLLLEDHNGARRVEVGLVPFGAPETLGMKGRLLHYKTDNDLRAYVSALSSNAPEVEGSALRQFVITPWPAMAGGGSGNGRRITDYAGPWETYILSGKAAAGKHIVRAWRAELWQNGKVVADYSYPQDIILAEKSVPHDWWIVGKHVGTIHY